MDFSPVTSIMSLLFEQNMFSCNSSSRGLKTRRSTDIPGGKPMGPSNQTVCKLFVNSFLAPSETRKEVKEIYTAKRDVHRNNGKQNKRS